MRQSEMLIPTLREAPAEADATGTDCCCARV